MTKSTPTTRDLATELQSWVLIVERASRRRARVERLISAKGLLKPLTLAQRFVIKAREVGFATTVRIVLVRLRSGRAR